MEPGTNPERHGFLHTEECNIKWKEYLKCYDSHPILRTVIDICGREYQKLALCFKKERQAKAKNNHTLADKRRTQLVDGLVNEKLSKDSKQ